ncbi:MAG: mechanosensitive ion channel domain-containing protein, partial [bacterium]
MNSDNKISPRLSSLYRRGFLVLSVLMVLFAVMPNFAQDYNQAGQQQQNPQVSRDELRDMLTEILSEDQGSTDPASQQSASTNEVVSYDQNLIDDWQQTRTNLLGEKLARLVRKLPDYPQDFAYAMGYATSPDIGWGGFRVFITILITVVIGLLIEQFTIRKLLDRLYLYVDSQEKTTVLKYKFIVTRALIQLIGVVVLALVTYSAAIYFRNDNPYFELLFNEILSALVMLRLWMILLRNIFSPNRSTLRPIPLDDDSSGQLHRWFIVFFFIIEFGNALFVYLTRAGMSEAQLNGFLIPYTLSLNLIILSRVWKMRKKITGMFVNFEKNLQQQSFAREFLFTVWPYVFTAWLLSLWMMWLYKAFLGSWEEAGFISISWWITLAFFVADRIFYGLIKNVGKIEWLQSPTYDMRSSRFIKITLNGFRLLMIAVAVYMFSLAWGLTPGAIMQSSLTNKFLGHGINLLAIATITYIVWELFNALIERKLPKETDALAALEGEGGGAGATRAETLLPLMRTTLTVVLITFVLLSVLHTLGIAITPLLAGAGVVGIAIGFGAQKLVQDVLSGIFFLVDDAFRKSEYIEIENLRGTVEKISLRSMQLRHHLGAVQT